MCLSGPADLVHETREAILNETPLALVSPESIYDVLETMDADDAVAVRCGGRRWGTGDRFGCHGVEDPRRGASR